jgi:beta-lactamase regulating signal transducer with metallopeptidase domain
MGPTIETLNELAAASTSSILRATWQGGLAITVAWALVRCWRGLPPRVACWVWRLVDLKLIVALLWTGPLLLPVLPPLMRPELAPTAIAPGLRPSTAGGSEPVTSLAATPAFARPTLAAVMLVFWLAGVVGAVSLETKEWLGVARLRRSCPPLDCTEIRCVATELACVLGLRRVPDLRAGPVVARPMVVGALRPAILLPAEQLRGPRSTVAIRSVLAHELAHVHRGDLYWGVLAGLVRALFFFHPLVWLAHREGLVAREAACDALALQASRLRPSEYARVLLDVAGGGPDRLWRWATILGIAGSAGSLKRRILAMKTTRQPSRRFLLSWVLVLLAVGAVGVVPWRLVPRRALAQNAPATGTTKEPARADTDKKASSVASPPALKLAEASLEAARAERTAAEYRAVEAQAEAEEAVNKLDVSMSVLARSKRLQARSKRLQAGLMGLQPRRAVARRRVGEAEGEFQQALAAEHEARAMVALTRAALDAARAAVRESEARRDIAKATVRAAENDRKEAQGRLRSARLDRLRAESRAARADIDRAEAKLKKAKDVLESKTNEYERFRQLAQTETVEHTVLYEAERALNEARDTAQEAEADAALAHARLKAAEARLRAADRRPQAPPPASAR